MLRKLVMDEVHVGMYITVTRGKISQRHVPSEEGIMLIASENDHYNGKVLEVISLEMPYAAVACHSARRELTICLDLRFVETMRLSKEYVTSLCPDIEYKEPDPFWNEGTSIEEVFKDM